MLSLILLLFLGNDRTGVRQYITYVSGSGSRLEFSAAQTGLSYWETIPWLTSDNLRARATTTIRSLVNVNNAGNPCLLCVIFLCLLMFLFFISSS